MTKQRELILRLVREGDSHKTAEQIWQAAKREMPSIVMATVYNNLNALADAGEIARIRVANGPDHFDKTLHRHFHLVCDKCGKMCDLSAVIDPTREIEEKYGIRVNAMELNAHYICKECEVTDS
jgi:Fe2+ or Zn2+ uptake regulation protein